ncbi:hypothetical protein PI125_g6511 [Phytophthora idaei]|nr:hypothetical protein PI125_g6511 [Phytophthora idaei]
MEEDASGAALAECRGGKDQGGGMLVLQLEELEVSEHCAPLQRSGSRPPWDPCCYLVVTNCRSLLWLVGVLQLQLLWLRLLSLLAVGNR